MASRNFRDWLTNIETRNPGLLAGLGQIGGNLAGNAPYAGVGGLFGQGGLGSLGSYLAAMREEEAQRAKEEEEAQRRREEHELRMEAARQQIEDRKRRFEMEKAQAKLTEGESKTRRAAMLEELAKIDPEAARLGRDQPEQALLEALRAARQRRETPVKYEMAAQKEQEERTRRRAEEQSEQRRRLSSLYQGRRQLAAELGLPEPEYSEETFVALEGQIPTTKSVDRGKELMNLSREQDIIAQRIKGLRGRLQAIPAQGGVLGDAEATEGVAKQIAALEAREAALVEQAQGAVDVVAERPAPAVEPPREDPEEVERLSKALAGAAGRVEKVSLIVGSSLSNLGKLLALRELGVGREEAARLLRLE